MNKNGNVLLRECEPFFHMSHDELLQKAVELQREVNILKSENNYLKEYIDLFERENQRNTCKNFYFA